MNLKQYVREHESFFLQARTKVAEIRLWIYLHSLKMK